MSNSEMVFAKEIPPELDGYDEKGNTPLCLAVKLACIDPSYGDYVKALL